tara:strand:- start:2223 stop:2474 length:252 start_codon:yes stop_codon:yes gene_type:complete
MAIVCTPMDTPSVLFVTPGKAETAMFTITNPPMQDKITWNPEVFPVDFLEEESLRESARNMASPLTETSYASIIEIALDELLG